MKIIFKEMTIFFIFTLFSFLPGTIWAEESSELLGEPTLTRAVMCESIQKFEPNNIAVVFSIDVARIHCFTEFDPVPKQTIIFHKWYQSGSLVSVKQLTVNPPRWSSISSMQLRDADKGPWQVEVTDKNGKLLHTLRFSITD
ncbi:MAG: DUF2914 domain-containing protein [Desulforhopalus sp.]